MTTPTPSPEVKEVISNQEKELRYALLHTSAVAQHGISRPVSNNYMNEAYCRACEEEEKHPINGELYPHSCIETDTPSPEIEKIYKEIALAHGATNEETEVLWALVKGMELDDTIKALRAFGDARAKEEREKYQEAMRECVNETMFDSENDNEVARTAIENYRIAVNDFVEGLPHSDGDKSQ